MGSSEVAISGTISNVHFSSPAWSAGRLITQTGENIGFAGKFFAKPFESVTLKGHWDNDPKFGQQFKVQSMLLNLDLDDKGLANYLANHPDIKGIGPKRASRIAELYGRNFEEVLFNAPEVIASQVGVSPEVIDNLKTIWNKNKQTNVVATRLSAFDLSHYQVSYLMEKLGDSALSILTADPYVLSRYLPGFGFKRVDLIARKLGMPKNQPERIRAGIFQCVSEMLSDGHCWTEFQELLERTNRLLVMDDLESEDLIEHELRNLIDAKELHKISSSDGHCVGLPAYFNKEQDLAEFFRQGGKASPHLERLGGIASLIDLHAPTLNQLQREAASTALCSSISLISGPGGTGKSYTIAAIADLLSEQGLHIILTAPTGKAAKRLEQLGEHPAMTIHRMLGYNGFEYQFDHDNPISADVIIVDEVSICSTELLWRLAVAVDLQETSIILVGDHKQLPPVGAGNPLRDLIQSRVLPTVILDQCLRQAGPLKENSNSILKGKVAKSANATGPHGRSPWSIFDRYTTANEVHSLVVNLFRTRYIGQLGYDPLRDVQVLTPTHKGILGTRALNISLQQVIQKKLFNTNVLPVLDNQRPRFYLHDKVIQTKNNYKLGVMNGAVGRITDVNQKRILVDFDDKVVEFKRQTRSFYDLELAYAISIHRFQGSEVPCAILVVHRSHAYMHHRNLFYTGVTRAKEMAVIVGDRWGIGNCAKRTQVDRRRTYLSLLLDR